MSQILSNREKTSRLNGPVAARPYSGQMSLMRLLVFSALPSILLLIFSYLPLQAQYGPLADSISTSTGFVPVGGNSMKLTKNGEEFMRWLLEDIHNATQSVEIEYYWFDNDKAGQMLRTALMEKARQGVAVRVIMDNLIDPTAPEEYYDVLRRTGADVRYFRDFKKIRLWKLPATVLGQRNHKKIVVIDNKIAYTGGMNFCDAAAFNWEDTQMRIVGPAANEMRKLFLKTWTALGGEAPEMAAAAPQGNVVAQVIYSDASPMLENIYVQTIRQAKRYFYIQTPYMVPPQALLDELVAAKRRGVDVRIIIPTSSDWPFMNEITRDYFPLFMQEGIRIYEYGTIYDHSKVFVSDDILSSCGTVNLDNRSFHINCENALLFHDSETAVYFRGLLEGLMGKAHEIQPGEGDAKGLRRVWRSFIKLFSPLL